ncbi:ABC transporter permease [Ktedonosporobacter rubrisoli]|uniref:ABC transporter permease n=1 Tax=Ktedonosporobacter rubrisoli TaxID=2509675 RepID=A0A4P6JUN7_KTERU|nr:ABC transporter permease [Ktedonosporobacter rubrisoli]QBD79357.1 ABC transporter permease [Ktedonosporobacter rubrisoli]
MSSVSQTPGKKIPSPIRRRDTVVMGRRDFFSEVIRLMGVELYKLRRRAMSKVLSISGLIITLIAFGLYAAISISASSSPASHFLPATCTQASQAAGPCLNHTPTPLEAEQAKQTMLKTLSEPLRIPGSLGTVGMITSTIGLILIIILAGTIVGGEYNVGTIRLMFTRGPTRTQFFLAKLGAILVCLILGIFIVTLLSIAMGIISNILMGVAIDLKFLTVSWVLHAILYMLTIMFGLFIYAMLALCLSTLGRTTAAGVAGALVWWVVENALGGIITLVGPRVQGALGRFLQAIPAYFLNSNIEALSQNQDHYLFGNQPSSLTDLHAIVILAVYLILFIGLSWWVNERRDVTN